MKTAQENETIERLLPHIAAAFNETDTGLCCSMSYDRERQLVQIDGYDGAKRVVVDVAGDSPLAVVFDVVKQLYYRMV